MASPAQRERVAPIYISIRPPIRGLDISRPPQTIDILASPELMNVHFVGGQLQTRMGFAMKYPGVLEPVINMWPFYTGDGTYQALLAFGLVGVWQFHTDSVFKPVLLYDNSGPGVPTDLTTLDDYAYFSIAVGSGAYTPHDINGAAKYPTSGYDNILAFTNGVDGVFIIIPASDGDPLVGEIVDDAGTDGFSGAVAVAFFANRLVVFGTSINPSEITYSVAGSFEDFAGTGSGTAVLADDADRIQAALLMQEFIVVYKERSLYIGRATGRSDIPIVFEKGPGGNIGTIAPMSVVGTADEHFFLGSDNVYKFSPEGLVSIGDPIRDELFGRVGSNGIDPAHVIRSFGALVREYSEYWLFTASGNVPEAVNCLENGDMSFVIFDATVTLGDATLSGVPSTVFPIIRRLSDITSVDHAVIPAATTILSYDATANTIEMSANATGTVPSETVIANNKDGWTLVDETGSAAFETIEGGNIGGVFQRITTVDVGAAYFETANAIPVTTVGAGQLVSIVLWVRSPAGIFIRVYANECNGAGAFIGFRNLGATFHMRLYNLPASTTFQPIILSFTSTSAAFRTLNLQIGINTGTGDPTGILDIDAISVVDITNVDPRYLYRQYVGGTDLWFAALGLLSEPASNNVTLIPYIAGSIGPWLCDTLWVYNYAIKSWSVWRLFANCTVTDTTQASAITIGDLKGSIDQQSWRFDTQELVTLSPSNLLGGTDGQVYEMAQKYRYDYHGFLNQPVLSYWQSKDFDLDAPNQDKTISRVTIFHERSHAPTSIQVGVSLDSGNVWTRQTVTIRSGYTETYADFFLTGPQARFEVRANSPGFYITGFSLKVVPRGESNAF